jgi:predicted esterase
LETNNNYHPSKAEVFYLYSRNDEFYPLEKFEKFDEKLRKYLPDYKSKSYDAKHEITEEMREDMRAWLRIRAEN